MGSARSDGYQVVEAADASGASLALPFAPERRYREAASVVAQFGVIAREPNPPGVDLVLWRRIAALNPRLRRQVPRDVTNPFTGKPYVHVSPDTYVEIVRDGVPIGAITRSPADDHELDVWATDDTCDEVERVALALARELDGAYTSFRERES